MKGINEKFSNFQDDPNSFINLNVKHIPSIGDPWVMFYQNKKERSQHHRNKNVKQSRSEYNPYDYSKNYYNNEQKNSIREKAEKKKADKLAKQTK